MPFALKVTKGPGEGSEFAFEESEAKLGRTADNDIVVKDSGASRSHCRVYAKGERYFVEDLKSANGTKLNGALLSAPKEIRPGDTITIGDVVFTFALGNDTGLHEPLAADTGDETEDPNATLLKPPPPPRREAEPVKRSLRKPPPARHDTEGEIGTVPKGSPLADDKTAPPQVNNSTMEVDMKDVGKLTGGAPDVGNSTMEVPVPPPMSLVETSAPARRSAPIAKVDDSTRDLGLRKAAKPAAEPEEQSQMTAADRARKRRSAQKSASGRIALGWSELPKIARIAFTAFGVLFVLGTGAFVVTQMIPKDLGPKKVEPTELTANGAALRDSFGAGDDVTWPRPDMKMFNFTLASPTQVVAVLHFGARDISKEEVSITVNGAEVGYIPPDTLDAARDIEVVMPPSIVKPREPNQLVFDSTKNPPGNDPWRIYGIWIEIIPIPELSATETALLAKNNILNGDKLFDSRSIGPENLFKAWKVYREAWLLLESMPDKSQSQDVYVYARARMREIRPMLDQKCSALMIEYQKAMNARPANLKLATQLLRDVERYYPTREHPCFGLSKSMLSDMEAW